jgi:hypothetical protein
LWEEAPEDDSDGEWTWEPPDLLEDQPWHRDRIVSLKKAIEGLPDASEHSTVIEEITPTKDRNACNFSGGNFHLNIGRTSEKEAA